MINELKLQISSEELKELVSKRATYHEAKASALEAEVGRLGEVLGELDEEAQNLGKFSNSTNDPVQGIKTKAKAHRDRATYFKFFSTHIVPNESYSLSQNDLFTLEVIGR